MRFNHNDHYHRLLLVQVPPKASRALDIGCGTGRFARKLAARGLEVEGWDAAPEVIEAARAISPTVDFQHRDVTREPPPRATYDVISCIASIHHMPFETVSTLREALRPGGVLLILGLSRATPSTWPLDLLTVPANLVMRALYALRKGERESVQAPTVWPPPMTLAEIRKEAASLLPGSQVRRLLYWRYLLVYREGDRERW